MIDQLRAIDNKRLMKKTGKLPKDPVTKGNEKHTDYAEHLTYPNNKDEDTVFQSPDTSGYR